MASNSEPQSCCTEYLGDYQPSAPPGIPTAVQAPEPVQIEYDFVEEPPREYFCPVTFELLSDPQQTECCGHLLSGKVVSRLQREGKSCPLCNDPNFKVINDKHFKRKANELKVRCPHKRNGCEWVGELGNLDQHSSSCPKRPWQCKHCDFEGTYDVGTTDHLPNCTKYPKPCPNQCEIGTVPRCDMEKHLTQCPLQLVECEFAQAGCQVRVPRRVLARHMEEEGQRHLLSMSLLNLGLTRELHQKMAEKDQQIAELQEQMQRQNSMLQKQIKDLQEQTEKQLQTQLDAGFSGIRGEIQTQDGKLTDLQREIPKQITGMQKKLEQKLADQRKETQEQITQAEDQLKQKLAEQRKETKEQITEQRKETEKQISRLQTQLQNENETLRKTLQLQLYIQEQDKQIPNSLCVLRAFSPPFEITLTDFSVHKAGGVQSTWRSDSFYSHTGGYKFQLSIDINESVWDPFSAALMFGKPRSNFMRSSTYCSAFLSLMKGVCDDSLSWPIQITAHLQLLNQRGDHGHVVATLNRSGVAKGSPDSMRFGGRKFISHSELEHDAAKGTEYLKHDRLCFRLYLKVDLPQKI